MSSAIFKEAIHSKNEHPYEETENPTKNGHTKQADLSV